MSTPLRILPIQLLPREPDEARALRSANGADLQGERSTRFAVVGFLGVLAALVLSALLAGCSPADWAPPPPSQVPTLPPAPPSEPPPPVTS